MMNKKHLKLGFTLVETVLAICMLLIVGSLIYRGSIPFLKSIKRAAIVQEAQNYAFNELWRVYNLADDNLKGGITSTPTGSLLGDDGRIVVRIIPDKANPRHVTLSAEVYLLKPNRYLPGFSDGKTPVVSYHIERYFQQ